MIRSLRLVLCVRGSYRKNTILTPKNTRKMQGNGKLGHSCTNVTNGKLYGSRDSDHAIVHLRLNVSSSAHNCGGWW